MLLILVSRNAVMQPGKLIVVCIKFCASIQNHNKTFWKEVFLFAIKC